MKNVIKHVECDLIWFADTVMKLVKKVLNVEEKEEKLQLNSMYKISDQKCQRGHSDLDILAHAQFKVCV